MDVRCPHRKFGALVKPSGDEGEFEVACPSRWCGRREDTVILHVFSTQTGKLLRTRRFRNPNRRS